MFYCLFADFCTNNISPKFTFTTVNVTYVLKLCFCSTLNLTKMNAIGHKLTLGGLLQIFQEDRFSTVDLK
jgi:hypothetical protein